MASPQDYQQAVLLGQLGALINIMPILQQVAGGQSVDPHSPMFRPRDEREAACARAFVHSDVSRNGKIDWTELRYALQVGYPQWQQLFTRHLAQQLLRSFDGDGNMELDWLEFQQLYSFIMQINTEYEQLKAIVIPGDAVQNGRCTGYKVKGALTSQQQLLASVPPHYVNVIIDGLIPDDPATQNQSSEHAREIPFSTYLRFRSEVYLLLKTFDRLQKAEMSNEALLSKENLLNLFCELTQQLGAPFPSESPPHTPKRAPPHPPLALFILPQFTFAPNVKCGER